MTMACKVTRDKPKFRPVRVELVIDTERQLEDFIYDISNRALLKYQGVLAPELLNALHKMLDEVKKDAR